MNWGALICCFVCLVQTAILLRVIHRLRARLVEALRETESVRCSWKRTYHQDQAVIQFLANELKQLRNRTGG